MFKIPCNWLAPVSFAAVVIMFYTFIVLYFDERMFQDIMTYYNEKRKE